MLKIKWPFGQREKEKTQHEKFLDSLLEDIDEAKRASQNIERHLMPLKMNRFFHVFYHYSNNTQSGWGQFQVQAKDGKHPSIDWVVKHVREVFDDETLTVLTQNVIELNENDYNSFVGN